MRNKSRKVSKAKLRKTKRRVKLRRAIRGGAEALPQPETLNQSGALAKTEALKKMKAIKDRLVYLEQGAWSGVNPYRRLKQEYKENMGKYFEESGSYALMDHIIKKGYTDDGSTVVFNRDQIVSISGIKGSDLENLCLFLYIVMCFFKRFKEDKDFVGYVNFLKKDFIPAINGNTQDTKIRKRRLTKEFITEYAKWIKEYLIYGLKLDSEAFEKSRKSSLSFSLPKLSLPKLSFYKTKKVGSATANTTTKANAPAKANATNPILANTGYTSQEAAGSLYKSRNPPVPNAANSAKTNTTAANAPAITTTNATAPAITNTTAITSTNAKA